MVDPGHDCRDTAQVLATAALALALAAPAPTDAAAPRVGVVAVTIDGELVEARSAAAQARLDQALARGPFALVDLRASTRDCGDAGCRRRAAETAGVRWWIAARLHVEPGARDYAVEIVAYDVERGEPVASVSGVCELCGFEEALGLVEARAAAALGGLERLWASRGARLTMRSTPDEVTLEVDGTLAGTTPVDVRLAAGRHRIVARKPGYLAQTLEVEATDGVDRRLLVQLEPAPPVRDRSSRRWIVAGALTGALGLAAVGVGAGLLALDARPYRRDCQADADGDCRFRYGTRTAGIVTIAIGAAGVIAGAAVLGTGLARRGRARHIALGAGGVGLRF